jgi:peptidase inhibitor I78 family protein
MSGPEVPFPLRLSFEKTDALALCPDCTFPMMVEGEEIPFPLSVKSVPKTVEELIGRLCRVIISGDHIKMDYNPNRVNIILDEKSRIKDISFG